MKKMNKKLISILLAVIMIFGTTAVGLTAFAEGDEWNCAEQGHVALEGSLKTNSSTQHSYICEKCGQTVYENHTFPDQNPDGTCSSCGYKYDCATRGHFLGGTYATQCSDKSHTMKCLACGETWEEKHTFTSLNEACDVCGLVYEGCTDATHFYEVSEDKTTHSCAYCDKKNVEHSFNAFGNCIDCGYHSCQKFGHTYKGGYEYDDNYHWKVCDYCGFISYDGTDNADQDIKKGAHKDDNKDGVCDICNFFCGHKWQLTSHTDPSCTAAGADVYTCAFCGDQKSETIAARGHYWFDDSNEAPNNEYVTFEFSSNFEACTLTFKCRRPECGHTVSYTVYTNPSDVGAVLAGKENHKPIKKHRDATCEIGAGETYYAFFTITPALKEMGIYDVKRMHSINEYIDPDYRDPENPEVNENPYFDADLKAAVDAAGGLDEKINAEEECYVCMLTFTDSDPLGHDYEYVYNEDATCTKDGTKTQVCQREGCGKHGETVVAEGTALGHIVDENAVIDSKDPTCTEPGYKNGECERCHEIVTQNIPALGHDIYEDMSKHVDPTCTTAGSETLCCHRCDFTETNEIPKLNHTWSDYELIYHDVPGEESQWCTQDGYNYRYCLVCGQPDEEVPVPGTARGHVYVYKDTGDEDTHLVACKYCGMPIDYKAHVDGNYDFICDECGHEMSFWHHWLHYLVGLPTYGFGNFFTNMMSAFTKFIRMITKDMI